jgi:hypothetical protein
MDLLIVIGLVAGIVALGAIAVSVVRGRRQRRVAPGKGKALTAGEREAMKRALSDHREGRGGDGQ